jgi:hypothetical protein
LKCLFSNFGGHPYAAPYNYIYIIYTPTYNFPYWKVSARICFFKHFWCTNFFFCLFSLLEFYFCFPPPITFLMVRPFKWIHILITVLYLICNLWNCKASNHNKQFPAQISRFSVRSIKVYRNLYGRKAHLQKEILSYLTTKGKCYEFQEYQKWAQGHWVMARRPRPVSRRRIFRVEVKIWASLVRHYMQQLLIPLTNQMHLIYPINQSNAFNLPN